MMQGGERKDFPSEFYKAKEENNLADNDKLFSVTR